MIRRGNRRFPLRIRAGQSDNFRIDERVGFGTQLLLPASDFRGRDGRLFGQLRTKNRQGPAVTVQAVRFDERAALRIRVAQRDFADFPP